MDQRNFTNPTNQLDEIIDVKVVDPETHEIEYTEPSQADSPAEASKNTETERLTQQESAEHQGDANSTECNVANQVLADDSEHQGDAQASVTAHQINRQKLFTIGAICAAVILGCWLISNAYTQATKTGAEIYKTATQTTTENMNAQIADLQNQLTAISSSSTQEEAALIDPETCNHEWEDVTETIHHDAVTHEVEHPTEYKIITENHTVCNICHEVIDGITEQHKQETDHNSFTLNVPVEKEVVAQEAYTETVVDEEAYDETVVTKRRCIKCGIEEDT